MWKTVLAFACVLTFVALATLSLTLALAGPPLRAGLVFAASLLALLALATVMREGHVAEEGFQEV